MNSQGIKLFTIWHYCLTTIKSQGVTVMDTIMDIVTIMHTHMVIDSLVKAILGVTIPMIYLPKIGGIGLKDGFSVTAV